jgi:hypothetical protein
MSFCFAGSVQHSRMAALWSRCIYHVLNLYFLPGEFLNCDASRRILHVETSRLQRFACVNPRAVTLPAPSFAQQVHSPHEIRF